jgi:DNA-binding CsgD family transcriptional regulator
VVGVLATGPVGAAVGICGLVTGAISLDPPSASYKHVSRPVRLRKIHVRAGKGVSARSASALSMTGNAMIEASTAGKAFLDAYQRYQGAVAAGSVQWMGRQLTATLDYGRAFAAQIRHAAGVLTTQRSALLRSPMATRRLSSRQIARALRRARGRRLSPEVAKRLRRLGLSAATIRAYLRRLPAKPPAHTTTALAPILNPTFAKELLGFATGLEQYLEKLQREPLV